MTDRDKNRTGKTTGQNQPRQGKQTGQGLSGSQQPFRCERCQTSFDNREELDRHEQRMHQGEMEPGRR